MKKNFLFVIILLSSIALKAQELNVNVKVSAPRLNLVDPKVFQTLEKQISEFINNTKWTDDEFEPNERIEGNLNITITAENSATNFSADIYVQIIRPVFNSNYKSQVLNFVDKVSFAYQEFQPIENSFNSYYDPLSSLLTYYAYMMLGADYDTYSLLGGDKYYQIAQKIVQSIPSNLTSMKIEWMSDGNNRNKYWMMENMMNPRVRPLRQAIYEYYINSMDKMHEDASRSRAIMLSALTTINSVHRSYPNSVVVPLFVDSKRNEIIEIFKGGGRGEQSKVYDIMVNLDPAQASQYNSIR
jgi:hypothetical protein